RPAFIEDLETTQRRLIACASSETAHSHPLVYYRRLSPLDRLASDGRWDRLRSGKERGRRAYDPLCLRRRVLAATRRGPSDWPRRFAGRGSVPPDVQLERVPHRHVRVHVRREQPMEQA